MSRRKRKGQTPWASPVVTTRRNGKRRSAPARPPAKDLQPNRTLRGTSWDRKGRPRRR